MKITREHLTPGTIISFPIKSFGTTSKYRVREDGNFDRLSDEPGRGWERMDAAINTYAGIIDNINTQFDMYEVPEPGDEYYFWDSIQDPKPRVTIVPTSNPKHVYYRRENGGVVSCNIKVFHAFYERVTH